MNAFTNNIYSGVVDTPLATALGSADVVFQRMVSRSALQRLAQPEEIARCILFLLSDASSFVTGSVSSPFFCPPGFVLIPAPMQVLNADGGFQ